MKLASLDDGSRDGRLIVVNAAGDRQLPAHDIAPTLQRALDEGGIASDDIGLRQQVQLHDELAASGDAPPVIDSGDFLRAPEAHLRALCAWLGIDFSDRMLHWPKGPRASDGIWAPHWYAHVWESTGFEAPQPRAIELTAEAAAVAEACLPHYRRLHALRMRLD